jgi:hypothetical protein
MKLARFFLPVVAAAALPLVTLALATLAACGDDDGSGDAKGAVDAGARLDGPVRLDASCEVILESPPLVEGSHQPEGTALTWNSNPPSSGPHFPVWAHFKEYTTPIPRGYLVHSLEHGAVALLYKCEQACPAVVEELRKIRDALPTDPMCSADTRVRVIIAPDPELDVPVAAAAWGWTYKAQCVDAPTLTAFAREHYAKSPENICASGRSF